MEEQAENTLKKKTRQLFHAKKKNTKKNNNPFAKLHIVNSKCVPCGNRKTDFKEKASDLKSAGSMPANYTFWLLVLQLELEIFISRLRRVLFLCLVNQCILPGNVHIGVKPSRQLTREE